MSIPQPLTTPLPPGPIRQQTWTQLPDLSTADPVLPSVIQWVTVVGAWGDTLITTGEILHLLKERSQESVGVIYYGQDPAIPAFLISQPWCSRVFPVIEPDDSLYWESLRSMPWRPLHSWLPARLENIDSETIAYTHLKFGRLGEHEPHIWHGAELPQSVVMWAKEFRLATGPFRLLHAVSTQSSSWESHWPHWPEAIEWLLESTPYTYVLTGWKSDLEHSHSNLIDLRGETETMTHVLALAEESQGIIATSNSLGYWSIIQGLPAVIACNELVSSPAGDLFHRWLSRPPVCLIEHSEGMERFQECVATL